MPAPRMMFKITVLGDGGVGKTALTVQFTMAQFIESYDPTIEDCYRKQWVVDDQPCLLEVLDTAGQEEYTALRDQWIRDGEGFLIVYSICNRSTFERIERIVERIQRVKEDTPTSPTSPYSPYPPQNGQYAQRRAPIPITIVGNKRDMYNAREVSTDEGRMLAQRMGCEFFETSAKQNANVENAFKSVVRGIKVVKSGGEGRVGGGVKKKKKKGCVIL